MHVVYQYANFQKVLSHPEWQNVLTLGLKAAPKLAVGDGALTEAYGETRHQHCWGEGTEVSTRCHFPFRRASIKL
jgi:hypothetical protein